MVATILHMVLAESTAQPAEWGAAAHLHRLVWIEREAGKRV
jgi:hypothetical protein